MPRGRKPLATEVKKMNGTFIKNPKYENKKEPKPKKGWPTPTELVSADPKALEKWNETCQILEECNVLTTADRDLLELFCINHSQYYALVEKVAKIGIINEFVNSRGETVMKRSPYQAELGKIADRQQKLLTEFGLTPSSRSRIQTVSDSDAESPFDKWMERGGLN